MSSVPEKCAILVLALLAVLTLYKFIIHTAFVSPLSRLPNAHWSSQFSRIWILWTRYQRQENAILHDAHIKLGPIIRLGPNEISVNGVDGGIRVIYGGGFEKGDWYAIFDNYGVPCMFSAPHAGPHSVRKRMVSHVYSKSTLSSSPAMASQATRLLFGRLLPILMASMKLPQGEQELDVHELWFAVTMDFITAYQFGLSRSSNFLMDAEYRKHWLGLYQKRKKYTFFAQELPQLKKFLQMFGVHLVPKWVDTANLELEEWCASICKKTLSSNTLDIDYSQNPSDEPVVLNSMIAGMEKEKRSKGSSSLLMGTLHKEPELSIASEMLDHLAAGHETSGITLTFLTWHLSKNPVLQTALRDELLTLDPPMKYDLTLSDVSTEKSIQEDDSWLESLRLPDYKQIDALPILHAVIMETLRLNASIPGGLPRVTPYPSCNLAGYEIPGGTRVQSAAWSLHRNADAFPDPNTWDYTRWLRRSDCQALKDRDRWFWAFSSGGRMCIGSNFAMHELKLITAAVYTNFTTHIVNDDEIEQEDGYTCGPKGNSLVLRFEKADNSDTKPH